MKVKLDIDTRTFVRFGLVVIGFVAAIGLIYLSRGALVIIGAALFLALALNSPVSWISHKLPSKSRVGATGLAYLIVIGLLTAIMFLVVPPILEQTAKFTQTVPDLIDRATSQRYLLDNFIDRYNLNEAVASAVESAKSQAAELSNQLAVGLVNGVSATLSGLFNLMFILVLCFFMLVEGPMWIKKAWGLYTDQDKLERHRASVNKMYRVVTGFVNGQITVAAIGATVSFIALLILSAIPSLAVPANLALPLAVIVFIMTMIPMVGATIGGVLVSLILLLNSFWAAVIYLIFFVIYQQIENNIISPRIQSKTVELSVLWVLVSILIGASIFGIVGGLISIPIAGCIRVLWMDYLEYAEKRRQADIERDKKRKKLKKAA